MCICVCRGERWHSHCSLAAVSKTGRGELLIAGSLNIAYGEQEVRKQHGGDYRDLATSLQGEGQETGQAASRTASKAQRGGVWVSWLVQAGSGRQLMAAWLDRKLGFTLHGPPARHGSTVKLKMAGATPCNERTCLLQGDGPREQQQSLSGKWTALFFWDFMWVCSIEEFLLLAFTMFATVSFCQRGQAHGPWCLMAFPSPQLA